MTYSATPTDFLMINATCTNEYELCQFAIIRMTAEDRSKIAESLYFLHKMQSFNCIDLVSVEYNIDGFYYDFGEELDNDDIDPLDNEALAAYFEQVLQTRFQMFDPAKPFKFIGLTADQLKEVSKPFTRSEQKLLPARLRINAHGKGFWIAYSSSSQDEFLTAEIDLNELLSLYDPTLKPGVKLEFFSTLNSTLKAAHQYFYLQPNDSITDVMTRYMVHEANSNHAAGIKEKNIASAQFILDNLQLLDTSIYTI